MAAAQDPADEDYHFGKLLEKQKRDKNFMRLHRESSIVPS